MTPDRVQHIKLELTDYVRERPNAGDTLDGIVRWWLSDGLRNSTRSDVEMALRQMCREGTMERVGRIYRSTAPEGTV